MAYCLNKNLPEYQRLKKVSGIPEVIIDTICKLYLTKYNRFPRLDELPYSDSSLTIKEELNLDKNNSTSIESILVGTNSKTIEEANAKLNNMYLDLEIKIIPIVDKAIILITKRPTDYNVVETAKNLIEELVSGPLVIMLSLLKLADLYGIKVNQITNFELNSKEWSHILPNDRQVNAFIYNGEIYINTDRYSPDSFVHEMLHLLIGSMRFTNPNMYTELINSVTSLESYDLFLLEYPEKTRNDANEEIFVSLLARYLSGMPSQLTNLNKNLLYEIEYTVRRVLDSILMGDISTKALTNNQLFNKTLRQVVDFTNSSIMTSQFKGSIYEQGSETHRKLNNMKSDLLKKGDLIEICN